MWFKVKYGKTLTLIAAIAFIAFHVLIMGGALAYGLHVMGIDVPFLDHKHGSTVGC